MLLNLVVITTIKAAARCLRKRLSNTTKRFHADALRLNHLKKASLRYMGLNFTTPFHVSVLPYQQSIHIYRIIILLV